MSDIREQLEQWANEQLDRDEVRQLLASYTPNVWHSEEDDTGGKWRVEASEGADRFALLERDASYRSGGLVAKFVADGRDAWHLAEWQIVMGCPVPAALVSVFGSAVSAPVSDRLHELAREVAAELKAQPGWESDACEVRDTFDAFVDAAINAPHDEATLREWLA